MQVRGHPVHTADLYWSLQFQQVGLGHEDLFCSEAKLLHFLLSQLHLSPWSASSHLKQAVYNIVQYSLVLDKQADMLERQLDQGKIPSEPPFADENMQASGG